jgi:adenosylcobinamide amidohydrolase
LIATFDADQETLSWSMSRPGFSRAQRIAWLEIRNADLPATEDAHAYITRRLRAAELEDAVILVTSRDIRRHHVSQSNVEGVCATCVTTVGLSNGERVGQRIGEPVRVPGTVNTLIHVAQPLAQAAQVEALSIAIEARTTAILDSRVMRAGVAITGSGTDCMVIASPQGETRACFAGTHTAIGEAIGAAVYEATREGIEVWRKDIEALLEAKAAAE